jgi:pSer/pThr/pTyr-binding forkhead associated (FHA) protein
MATTSLLAGERPLARPPAGNYLAVPAGDQIRLCALGAAVTTIGRRTGASLFLDDATVSPHHAVVVRRGSRSVVLDDRSLNGVLVNGRRVDEAVLQDGDVIALGRVRLRYVEFE